MDSIFGLEFQSQGVKGHVQITQGQFCFSLMLSAELYMTLLPNKYVIFYEAISVSFSEPDE